MIESGLPSIQSNSYTFTPPTFDDYRLFVRVLVSHGGVRYFESNWVHADGKAPPSRFDATPATIAEGGTAAFQLRLKGAPTGNVTVSVTSDESSLSANTLTFTPSNWSTAQTLTLTAAQDADAINEAATLTFSASGAQYQGETMTLPITVFDDEVPGKIAGLAASDGDGKTTLTWTDPSDTAIAGYQYQYSEDENDFSTATWTDMPGSTATTTSHEVTGLANGHYCWFQVRSMNALGAGQPSDADRAHVRWDSLVLTQEEAGDSRVKVSWTANPPKVERRITTIARAAITTATGSSRSATRMWTARRCARPTRTSTWGISTGCRRGCVEGCIPRAAA